MHEQGPCPFKASTFILHQRRKLPHISKNLTTCGFFFPHLKFDPTGVRTHDLQIMTVQFMSLRRLLLTTWPSLTLHPLCEISRGKHEKSTFFTHFKVRGWSQKSSPCSVFLDTLMRMWAIFQAKFSLVLTQFKPTSQYNSIPRTSCRRPLDFQIFRSVARRPILIDLEPLW